MILVDDRAGSQELIGPLRKLGLSVQSTRLDFGDVAFQGRGEGGTPVSVGIEFKRLEDMVQSSRNHRLEGYQLPGMRTIYDYSYLMVEGVLETDRQGQLVTHRGRYRQRMPGKMTGQELRKRAHVLHLAGGVTPVRTFSRADTLQEILALYRVWTDVDLDQHKSHLAIYVAPTPTPISDVRRTLSTFPHIGVRASLAVEQAFGGNLLRAMQATADEWAVIKIGSKHLGMKQAREIVAYCRKGMS